MTTVSEADADTEADAEKGTGANAERSVGRAEERDEEAMSVPAVTDSDLRVPDGETPALCPHCRRPFRTDHLRNLHVGDVHGDEWTDDQRAAYESAREAERDDLFVYHLKTIAALVTTYAVFLLTYMAVSAMRAPG